MKKELQKSLKECRPVCFVAVDQQEETGHIMYWDPLEGMPNNRPESVMSLRMLLYHIGKHKCDVDKLGPFAVLLMSVSCGL